MPNPEDEPCSGEVDLNDTPIIPPEEMLSLVVEQVEAGERLAETKLSQKWEKDATIRELRHEYIDLMTAIGICVDIGDTPDECTVNRFRRVRMELELLGVYLITPPPSNKPLDSGSDCPAP